MDTEVKGSTPFLLVPPNRGPGLRLGPEHCVVAWGAGVKGDGGERGAVRSRATTHVGPHSHQGCLRELTSVTLQLEAPPQLPAACGSPWAAVSQLRTLSGASPRLRWETGLHVRVPLPHSGTRDLLEQHCSLTKSCYQPNQGQGWGAGRQAGAP